jgi:hypothetical protein
MPSRLQYPICSTGSDFPRQNHGGFTTPVALPPPRSRTFHFPFFTLDQLPHPLRPLLALPVPTRHPQRLPFRPRTSSLQPRTLLRVSLPSLPVSPVASIRRLTSHHLVASSRRRRVALAVRCLPYCSCRLSVYPNPNPCHPLPAMWRVEALPRTLPAYTSRLMPRRRGTVMGKLPPSTSSHMA